MDATQISERCWKEGLPFFVPAAVEFLEDWLNHTCRVFEWGAGASTIWYARKAGEVVSIEHQPAWYARVLERLEREGLANVSLLMFPREPADVYAGAIDTFDGDYDLISVDGRNRVLCIRTAIPWLIPGGLLVLDNAERARYAPGLELLKDWERRVFDEGWRTTVFIKP